MLTLSMGVAGGSESGSGKVEVKRVRKEPPGSAVAVGSRACSGGHGEPIDALAKGKRDGACW